MDKESIFFFTIFVILYLTNQISSVHLSKIFNKFSQNAKIFIDLYNNILCPIYSSDDEEVENKVEEEHKIDNKPEIKYEDKFLDDIRKLEKEYIFTEEEKWIEKQKISEFLNTFIEEDDKKRKEFTEELEHIELKLTKYQNLVKDNTSEDNNNNEDTFEVLYNLLDDEEDGDDVGEESIEEKIATLLQNKNCIMNSEKEFKESIESNVYLEKRMKKAEELARKFIIDKRLDRLENSYIMESTPLGNVLMKYDKNKESFKYYSDNSIPYRYLEVVARKFVKQFNFRPIFVDMEEELKLTEEKWLQEKEKQEKEKEEKEKKKKEEALINGTKSTVEKKKNVFAKFKSYNKESGTGHVTTAAPPKNSIPNKKVTESQENEKILLKQRANRYTYEGKFANFNFLKKIDKKVVDKKLAMSFAEFKKTFLTK